MSQNEFTCSVCQKIKTRGSMVYWDRKGGWNRTEVKLCAFCSKLCFDYELTALELNKIRNVLLAMED